MFDSAVPPATLNYFRIRSGLACAKELCGPIDTAESSSAVSIVNREQNTFRWPVPFNGTVNKVLYLATSYHFLDAVSVSVSTIRKCRCLHSIYVVRTYTEVYVQYVICTHVDILLVVFFIRPNFQTRLRNCVLYVNLIHL